MTRSTASSPGRSAALADVVAAGVEPTAEEMGQARARYAPKQDVTGVLVQEAGTAAPLGDCLAEALVSGDAEYVASLVRRLRANSAAAAERLDEVAPAGVTP